MTATSAAYVAAVRRGCPPEALAAALLRLLSTGRLTPAQRLRVTADLHRLLPTFIPQEPHP
jgi:hypothetical protein